MGRRGDEFLGVLGGGDRRLPVSVRRERARRARAAARGDGLLLARLPAGPRPRPAIRLPRRGPVGAGRQQPLQPGEAAARSLRARGERADHVGTGGAAVRRRIRGRHRAQRRGQRAVRAAIDRRRQRVRLARRPRDPPSAARDGDLRAARERLHETLSRHPGEHPRHVRGARAPRVDQVPDRARRHGGGAAAGAPVRARRPPRREGTPQLLGVQLDRLLRAARRVRMRRRPRRAGERVQGHGEGAARRRPRGDSRRRLQPYGGRQSPGADAVAQGLRQRGVLPREGGRPPLLHGLHGHRQQPEHAAPADAAAGDGLAALLGDRDARGRIPVRPRRDARARAVRRRSPVGVLRHHPPGSDPQSAEADRGAVGRRRRRLSGRQLSGAVVRVEREVPRRGARLLAKPGGRPRRIRLPPDGQLGPVPERRAQAVREHQLHHGARRLHDQRSRLLQREAQRGERRGEPRRREPQPIVEPRRRGADRRSGDRREAAPAAQEPARDAARLAGGADDPRRRRDRPHAGRQQQRVLPGRRDLLVRLGARGPRAARLHAARDRLSPRARRLPPPPLVQRPPDPRQGRVRRRVAQAGRVGDVGRRLERGVREELRDVPERRRPRARRARPPCHRRELPAPLQRARRDGRVHAARQAVRIAVAARARHDVPEPRSAERPAGRRHTARAPRALALRPAAGL